MTSSPLHAAFRGARGLYVLHTGIGLVIACGFGAERRMLWAYSVSAWSSRW
jgi:hypothetical protein